jgi:hypothetical protein
MIDQRVHSAGIKESLEFLQRLSAERFYGTLELRFEAGNIVHLIEHRSMKPTFLTTPDKLEFIDDGHTIKANQE